MSKAKKVIDYYVLCNRLKDIVRTGWKDWKVNRERVESIAEHIFGVQMLAIAIKSEYKRDIDISRVVFMLAVHELEEIFIGDLTQFQISREEKKKIGAEAVRKVLDGLLDREQIASLIDEFDARETEDAQVAYFCDKLECDLQCKLYDEEGCVDLQSQEGNTTLNNSLVQELLSKGCSWSEMWMEFGQRKYNYDEDFMEVSNYAKTHKIKL